MCLKGANYTIEAASWTTHEWQPELDRSTDQNRSMRLFARPAVAEQRLSLTPTSKVRYELQTPFRSGTAHVIFEPLDFMCRTYGMPRA